MSAKPLSHPHLSSFMHALNQRAALHNESCPPARRRRALQPNEVWQSIKQQASVAATSPLSALMRPYLNEAIGSHASLAPAGNAPHRAARRRAR